MLKKIEDITVITGEELHGYEGELIFVDTAVQFKEQPFSQVFVGISDAEDTLPKLWYESQLYTGEIFQTYEAGVIHTFIQLTFKEQVDPEQCLFIKVIALGEEGNQRPLRLAR